MRKDKSIRKFLLFWLIVLMMASSASYTAAQDLYGVRSAGDLLLDGTFRVDIRTINVTYDYYPMTYTAACRASVTFTMRPGQSRPVFHLEPAIRNSDLVGLIRLNGETLSISNESDVQVVSFEGSTQAALEFRRDLAPGTEHLLEISYNLNFPEGYPRFSSEVSDLEGRGNEHVLPTLNTPHELARHILTFRVHGSTVFRCIGSGLVEETPSGDPQVQQWTLDTEREVASYSVMFALMPEADTVFEERDINGTAVRIMAFRGGASIGEAFNRMEPWLAELEYHLGPFPMPRGLSIFLVSNGGGMEYYGATITSLWALEHEVFHMYFACSTVHKTYRDSWMDEAITKWYELSMDPAFGAIEETYRSNIVSGRSPIAVGFDRRAYNEGARIMDAVARQLGGRVEMIAFLSYVHRNYTFAPFTTFDFLDYLQDYAGVDMTAHFLSWLYTDEENNFIPAGISTISGQSVHEMKVDMTPPRRLLEKYKIKEAHR